MFIDRPVIENDIYAKLLSDKLPANLGFLYENLAAQMITATGRELYYLRCGASVCAAAGGPQGPAAGAGCTAGAAAAQRAGAAVSGIVEAVLPDAGDQGPPQRKMPHDPLPQALLGRYGGDES